MSSVISLEHISSFPEYKVIVALPPPSSKLLDNTVRPVSGYLTGDISVTGGNQFSNILENQAVNNLQQNLQVTQSILGRFDVFKSALTKYSFHTTDASMDFWNSSKRPSFTINMVFVALRETDDVRKMVAGLYRSVYPTFEREGVTSVVLPPLGYQPFQGGLSAQGTMTVTVGKWFKAVNVIMDSVDFTFSKEVIASGYPLYASGGFTFHPYRELSYDEFLSFLPGVR